MRTETERMYGWAKIEPKGPVTAGSVGSWRLKYHVGEFGVDDGGRIIVANRFATDMGKPQTDRPSDVNYVTAKTTGKAKLRLSYHARGHVRPWVRTLLVESYEGYLKQDDMVTITYGDRSEGSPGMEMQTFCEDSFEFKVLVDPFGTGQPVELVQSPILAMVGGKAAKIVAIVPSTVETGESFNLFIRVEDLWGNLSRCYQGRIRIQAPNILEGCPSEYRFKKSDRGAHVFKDIAARMSGCFTFGVQDPENDLRADTNILLVSDEPLKCHAYWGDLHGQSEETIGTNTVDDYYRFARNVAALDFCAHQGNDFQITKQVWTKVRRAVDKHHSPGNFVTFLGYEWSGNTPNGGDRNVYYLQDGELHRSSHAQIEDISDIAEDRHPVERLYAKLRGKEVMIIPHVGGRYADLKYNDPGLEPLVEIYSEWGEFEWFLNEAMERYSRIGFVAGSDDHKGRPGAACPGRSTFGVYGGLTCVYAEELTRESLWKAFFNRRVYATTGQRILLRVLVDGHHMGEEYKTSEAPEIKVEVFGTSTIERVDIMRGRVAIYQFPTPLSRKDDEIRLVWGGARSRGRERTASWNGSLALDKGKILEAKGYAFDSPAEHVRKETDRLVTWVSSTSGDEDGVILRLNASKEASLTFNSPLTVFSVHLSDFAAVPFEKHVEGLDMRVRVERQPLGTGSRKIQFTYVDNGVQRGPNAYYVRVLQEDGGKAWSSPIYVNYSP